MGIVMSRKGRHTWNGSCNATKDKGDRNSITEITVTTYVISNRDISIAVQVNESAASNRTATLMSRSATNMSRFPRIHRYAKT